MESGLVGIAYFVIAACTTICVLSVAVNWRVCQLNAHLRRVVRRLKFWYAELFHWNLDQGLRPPTPDPRHVESVEEPEL